MVNVGRKLCSHRAAFMLLAACCGSACARTPLRIGYTPWPANDPITFAEARGTLPSGVRLSRLSSSNDLLIAFGAGQLELVVISATSALRLAANHVPVVAVAPMNISRGADGIVAVRGVTASSLAGRAAATSKHDDNLFLLFRLAGNRDPGTLFNLTKVDTDSRTSELFASGAVEIACLSDPMLLELERRGASVLASSRDFSDELVTLLVARRDVAVQRHAELRGFLTFWYRWSAKVIGTTELLEFVAREQGVDRRAAASLMDRIGFPDARRSLDLLSNPHATWYPSTVSYLATSGVSGVPALPEIVLSGPLEQAARAVS